MVSKASEDLPEPERPVNTTRRSRGISRSMFLRLCSRAPRMAITRAPSVDTCRRLWSKRSFMRSVGARGRDHICEAKAVTSARARSPALRARTPMGERSKNGGHSPVREGARPRFQTAVDNVARSPNVPLRPGAGRRQPKFLLEHLHLPAFGVRTNSEHWP